MEELSAAATGGREHLLDHWEEGSYHCARCDKLVFSSTDKWDGPCAWPSFRRAADGSGAGSAGQDDALSTTQVFGYNNYVCRVFELYCGACDLFIGHQFEDAREKGDTSNDAHWRF